MKRLDEVDLGFRRTERICPNHGPYSAITGRDALGQDIYSRCPICAQEEPSDHEKEYFNNLARAIEEIKGPPKLQEIDGDPILALLVNSGVSREAASATFSTFDHEGDEARHQVRLAFRELVEGRLLNLLVIGKTGRGKTHLAISAMRRFAEIRSKDGLQQPRMIYTTENRILRELKSSFNRSSMPSEQEIIDRYANADLLVIDEMGKSNSTLYNLTAIEEIIDRRHSSRPTIYLSNLDEEELKKGLTDGSLSRMSNKSGKYFLAGEVDYRRK